MVYRAQQISVINNISKNIDQCKAVLHFEDLDRQYLTLLLVISTDQTYICKTFLSNYMTLMIATFITLWNDYLVSLFVIAFGISKSNGNRRSKF